jgi:hypothetical protein
MVIIPADTVVRIGAVELLLKGGSPVVHHDGYCYIVPEGFQLKPIQVPPKKKAARGDSGHD